MSYEIATCSRLNFAGSAVREVTVPSVEVSSAALFLATSQHAPCDPLDQAEGKGHVHGLEEQPSEEATGGSLHGGGCTVVLSSRCSPSEPLSSGCACPSAHNRWYPVVLQLAV